MTTHLFKTIALSALAVMIGLANPARAADDNAAKPLSKSDVQKIVRDYIMDNPQDILSAVDNYQKKYARDRQNEGLSKNKDALFKDTSAPDAGNPDGDVTVVEFFDYNCHYCKNALPDILGLLEKDKKVRVVFKDFPILGPTSETASKWALAAQKQKKYLEYHKALMNNKSPINDALLEKIAKDVGLDVEQAKKDATSTEIMIQIEKNRSMASSIGLSGTPAFIIGDDITPGAVPLSQLEAKVAIQREKQAKDGKKDKK